MRTLLALLATLALSFMGAIAGPPPPPNLLQNYLSEPDAAKKAQLRSELLKLSPAQLRDWMDRLPIIEAPQSGDRVFELQCPDGFSRKFYLRLPDEYDHARAYPLIVLLHGGVNGMSSDVALQSWLTFMSVEQRKSCFLLAPTADCEETTINARWWREGGMKNIEAMLAWTRRRYAIDDDRVFLSGHSDGGSGTWAMAFRRNDAFAGFFPMVGHPLVPATDRTSAYYENLKGVNLYNISGAKDPVYPGAEVTKIVGEINNVGPKVLHKSFENAGHDMSYGEKEIPRIFDEYVAKWKRDLLAKSLDWSTERPCFGERAWLVIAQTREVEKSANKAPRAVARGTGTIRIDLGVRVATPEGPDDQNAPVKARHIEPKSVADEMGLKTGDVITKIDGKKVANLAEVNAAIREKGPGKEIAVTVLRDGKEQEFKGRFPPLEKDPPPGRALANWKPGVIDITVNNVSRLCVRLAPEMLDAKGEVRIKVNGREAFSGKPPGLEHMLDHFEQTHDRKWPFAWEIAVDVERVLKSK
jgi:poly(3-hydroxybutyrate) depolymerase